MNCEIFNLSKMKTQSLKEALAVSNSCSELVEAEYAGAQERQRRCLAIDAKQRQPSTFTFSLSEKRALDRAVTQAKVDSLEASLLQYWRACSAEADAKTARQIAEAGLDALKKAPAQKPAKKAAKRSRGPRTR